MQIIEISALSNGGHRNQTGNFTQPPDGWAVVPANMNLENFPFGEVEVEEKNGVMTVTNGVPGTIPEVEAPENTQNPTTEDVTWDSMADSIMEGVNEV